jgi:signal transduction histidine kinase
MAILRAAQVLPWLAVLISYQGDVYRNAVVVVGLYLAYLAWVAVLFGVALRGERMPAGWVVADLVVTIACVIAVGLSCRPGYATTWQNWVVGPAMGAAILSVIYLRWRLGTVSGLLIIGSYVLSVSADLGEPSGVAAVIGNVGSGVAFTVAAGLVAGRLRRTAEHADRSSAEALAARDAEARMAERVRQYDLLHTNVLTTLTMVAQVTGEVSPELRARCARDVDYVRTIGRSVIDAAPQGLNAALAHVVRDQAALGLDIHFTSDGLPHHLPADVVEAIAHAAREALNNAVKYARTNEAWLVATGEDDGSVQVTVTDRGSGFDLGSVTPGFGMSMSMHQRMTEVGGAIRVQSHPGQGTTVEIQWAT